MTIQQAVFNGIRTMNKYATNKLLIHISGKRFGHFAVLTHAGRKSGKLYRIPIIAEPLQNGFVIALTYGTKTDWCANVIAKGGCSLLWKNAEYSLRSPEFIDKETGLKAFPAFIRLGLRLAGVKYFLKLIQ
ncbi:MAG: hypothetical protein WBM17_03565 [Anaerolineales bacterium]